MGTAIVIFINNKLLYCANVGDSSSCLLRKTKVFITTEDKCTNKKEIKKIEKREKIFYGKLGGILAVSRGLGDFDLKTKGFICELHIIKRLIDHNYIISF